MNDHALTEPLAVEAIATSLATLGLAPGDQVMVHSDLRRFGMVRGAAGRLTLTLSPAVLYDALRMIVGNQGTVIVPTFSYSWTRGEVYSVDASPSFEGSFSEYVRTLPGAKRSLHPLMSVAAQGPAADDLTSETDRMSFGGDSSFARMHRANARHLTVGVSVCSFSDYVQWACRVPFRYTKRFSGVLEVNGRSRQAVCEHYVRYLNQGLEAKPIFEILDQDQSGRIRQTQLGGIPMRLVSSEDLFDLMRARLERDPYAFSTRPRDEQAIAHLSRLLAPDSGLAVLAANQEGCERWIWTISGWLLRIHLSLEGPGGDVLSKADQLEAYLDASRGLSLSELVTGKELTQHLLAATDEVTMDRLRRSGWLIRPVEGDLPPLSPQSLYRVRLEVRHREPADGAGAHGDGMRLALLSLGEEPGAVRAISLASEQLAHGTAESLLQRLLELESIAAVLPERSDPAQLPAFHPDLSVVAPRAKTGRAV